MNELSGTIEHWKWDANEKARIGITSIVPQGDTRDPGAADIHLSPDGRYVYASLRGEFNEIIASGADNDDGLLKIVQRVNAGGDGPRNFAISPDGKYVAVALQNSDKINQFNPDLIVTTVNKIIADNIVSTWRGKLINLHYSLLPSFGGVTGSVPVRQAIEYGTKFVGTTVHYVSEKVDRGVPIVQSVTPLYPEDTEDLVMEYLFRCGSICLLTGINNLIQQSSIQSTTFDMVEFDGRKSYFNPAAVVPSEVKKEEFWQGIKKL